jgi:hypothetical protein
VLKFQSDKSNHHNPTGFSEAMRELFSNRNYCAQISLALLIGLQLKRKPRKDGENAEIVKIIGCI